MNLLNIPFTFVLLICAVRTLRIDDPCITADNRHGRCVRFRDCSPLRLAFEQQPLSRPVISFIQKSACGIVNDIPIVCCHGDIDINAVHQKKPPRTTPNSPPVAAGSANKLPAYPNCGSDTTDKILSGTMTEIDEFPWMAMLMYTNFNGSLTIECGGVLINKRYILTAAHCVVGAITTKIGPLSIVRLGEHDISNELDCELDYCAPPPMNLEVEKVIAHPGFTDAKVNREDDIALVRLSQDVHFSTFVKPICLPTESPSLEVGNVLVVSGWGYTLAGKKSNVKLKLGVPIFNKSECSQKFAAYKAILTEKQICAGGKFAEDSCYGDSGGPLMGMNGPKWEAVAVVSFGYKCGEKGWPGVYTDVYKYMPWIRNNLKL